MTNLYKQFEKYSDAKELKEKTFSLKEFESMLMIEFGFAGRNSRTKSLQKWLKNFEAVGFIKIIKKPNSTEWVVTVTC